jgi:hypothetical protein
LGGRAPGTLESPLTPCTIEASVPNTMRFFQINVSSALPKPAASQVGSFSLDPSGVLTFTAGADTTVPPAPVITGISRAGNVTSVRVQTTNGPTYRLLYADVVNLTQPVTNWTAGASLPGTGGIITLEDMTGTGVRFYRAEAR